MAPKFAWRTREEAHVFCKTELSSVEPEAALREAARKYGASHGWTLGTFSQPEMTAESPTRSQKRQWTGLEHEVNSD